MSRLKNFTRSLMSSYAFLGVNILYTLGAVPLALHYLSKAEFGLWALTLQIAGYISLVDLGMNSSVARILIDHKDDRASGRYGGVIQSGFWVGAAQGAIALAVGSSLVCFLGDWLKVQPDLTRPFFWLMFGQVLLTAATFATRILSQLLYAWQRIDISNYCAISQLVVGFAVLWFGFHRGWGVFSLLAGAVASFVWGVGFNVIACRRPFHLLDRQPGLSGDILRRIPSFESLQNDRLDPAQNGFVPLLKKEVFCRQSDFQLPQTIAWQKRLNISAVNFSISLPQTFEQYSPLAFVAQGDFVNNSPYTLSKVRLTFVLFDQNQNIIGVSQRDESTVTPFERRAYKQLWPNMTAGNLSRVDVTADTNTLDPSNLSAPAVNSGTSSDLSRPK